MVTKNYNICPNGKDLEETYMHFAKEYSGKIKKVGINTQTFDINHTAVILNRISQEELNQKITNNFTLISTERLINKTIKEIKMNGFKLEKIIEK